MPACGQELIASYRAEDPPRKSTHSREKHTHSYMFRLGRNNIQHLFTCLPWLDQTVCVLCSALCTCTASAFRQCRSSQELDDKDDSIAGHSMCLPLRSSANAPWQRIRNTGSRKFRFEIATRRGRNTCLHYLVSAFSGGLLQYWPTSWWKRINIMNTHPRAMSTTFYRNLSRVWMRLSVMNEIRVGVRVRESFSSQCRYLEVPI